MKCEKCEYRILLAKMFDIHVDKIDCPKREECNHDR